MLDRLDYIKSKIVDAETLERWLNYSRFKSRKIVFTNGCFDIMHKGHVEYLAEASRLGDCLVVGLNSDKSVRKLKGEGRPVQDELSRAIILASMIFVDRVIIFDDKTPANLIKSVKPDFLVKGGDYNEESMVGSEFVKSIGGKIVVIDLVKGYSSTGIIERISSNY